MEKKRRKRRRPGGGKTRRLLKLALRSRDGRACGFCGKALSLREATLEDVVPFSQGGTNKMRNLKLSCAPCNRARGVRRFSEFAREARARAKFTREIRGLRGTSEKLSEECDPRPPHLGRGTNGMGPLAPR